MAECKLDEILHDMELHVSMSMSDAMSRDSTRLDHTITLLNSPRKYIKDLVSICKLLSDVDCTFESSVLIEVCESTSKKCQTQTVHDVLEALGDTISDKIKMCEEKDSKVLSIVFLFAGVVAIQEFIRCNWTGPSQDKPRPDNLTEILFDPLPNYRKQVVRLLSDNTDGISDNVRKPELLLLGKTLIQSVDGSCLLTKLWWQFRCVILHQSLLVEKNAKIHEKAKELLEPLLNSKLLENPHVKFCLYVEAGNLHLYYGEVVLAKQFFTNARNLIGMTIELSGAFGKRTKYQTKSLPQLFVKMKRDLISNINDWFEGNNGDLPKNVNIKDDVLLNQISFTDNEEVVNNLLLHEQVMLLAETCLLLKSSASGELLTEQAVAYLECLLVQDNVFCIRLKSLYLRCELEQHRSRKVERAMMQLEELLHAIRETEPDIKNRQYFFYCTMLPPYWLIEQKLANLLMSLGAVKSALEIYQRLDMWEDIVKCYQVLEENEKAASLVRQQIEKHETSALWCILGDVTDDITCYEKAWELSNHTSARAQCCMGYFYYKKRNYKLCIPFFQKSVELNHLQLNVWFSLAFAASQCDDYDLAAKSYRHVLNVDPDNFEAWNNLSNAYIRLKQKDRAYRTLQEALKCNYENWKVWENYLLVCVDVGAFEDAIQAYHRLIDIKKKYEDVEILNIIVRAVRDNLNDFTGQPASRLKPKVLELFGRITSIVMNNADIWKLYAKLHSSDPDHINDKEVLERVLTYEQKAHTCLVQKDSSFKDPEFCKIVLTSVSDLADVYLDYIKLVNDGVKMQAKTSAKLLLKGIIARIEKQKRDFQENDCEEFESRIELLSKKLVEVETS